MNKLENELMKNEKISLYPALFFSLIQACILTDNTALMNASSAIAATFKSNASDLQAANIMYPLMAGTIMITAGFVGKMLGWKRLMQWGLLVLALGELVAVISPNITVFVYCARVLAGIGGSLTVPAVLGIITVLYKGKQQAVVFGMIAATIAFSTAASPVISGIIIVYLSWEWVFVLLSILFAACFLYISFFITKDEVANSKMTFDYVGLVLLFFGLGFIIIGLMNIVKWGLIQPNTPPFTVFSFSPCLPVILSGIIIIWLLIIWEHRLENKAGVDSVLIPRAFITNIQTISSASMNAFIYFPLGGIIFLVLLYLQIFYGINAVTTGLIMIVFAAGMVPFSIFTPQFGGNFTPRAICITGIIVSFIGCIIIGFGITPVNGIRILFYIGLLILGAGVGLVASQSNFIVVASIKDKKLASQSSGLQGAMRNIGQAFAIALVGVIYISVFTYAVKSGVTESKIINSESKRIVSNLKSIPTSTRKTVINIINKKYDFSPRGKEDFLRIYKNSSISAFKITNIVLGIILLLFIIPAKNICSEKLKIIQKAKE